MANDAIPTHGETFEQAVTHAREFARGVVDGFWAPAFRVTRYHQGGEDWANFGYTPHKQNFIRFLNGELPDRSPPDLMHSSVLELYGFLKRDDALTQEVAGPGKTYVKYVFNLTEDALALLTKPSIPPSIFIGYKRSTSSALALLLEARMGANGIATFIDKDILSGEEWKRVIKTTIQERAKVFVGILSNGTLMSEAFQNEVDWAYDAHDRVLSIPVWQPDFSVPDNLNDYSEAIKKFVEDNNAIRVTEESAAEYDKAVSQLLNRLNLLEG